MNFHLVIDDDVCQAIIKHDQRGRLITQHISVDPEEFLSKIAQQRSEPEDVFLPAFTQHLQKKDGGFTAMLNLPGVKDLGERHRCIAIVEVGGLPSRLKSVKLFKFPGFQPGISIDDLKPYPVKGVSEDGSFDLVENYQVETMDLAKLVVNLVVESERVEQISLRLDKYDSNYWLRFLAPYSKARKIEMKKVSGEFV